MAAAAPFLVPALGGIAGFAGMRSQKRAAKRQERAQSEALRKQESLQAEQKRVAEQEQMRLQAEESDESRRRFVRGRRSLLAGDERGVTETGLRATTG